MQLKIDAVHCPRGRPDDGTPNPVVGAIGVGVAPFGLAVTLSLASDAPQVVFLIAVAVSSVGALVAIYALTDARPRVRTRPPPPSVAARLPFCPCCGRPRRPGGVFCHTCGQRS